MMQVVMFVFLVGSALPLAHAGNPIGKVIQMISDLETKIISEGADAQNAHTELTEYCEHRDKELRFEIKSGKDKIKRLEAKNAKGKANAESFNAKIEELKSAISVEIELATTSVTEAENTLASLQVECTQAADDFQAEEKGRANELKALAEAKKILEESSAADAAITRRSKMSSGAGPANFEATVRSIQDLAHKRNSAALAQLASTVAGVVSVSTEDAFAKIKGQISVMIENLEKEAEADAEEKVFCDKEMTETEAKKAEKEAMIEKLSTKIDSATAKSAKLKKEVAALEKELAALAKAQAEMDKVRAEEKAAFDTKIAEMRKGVTGVKQALTVLRDYYAKDEDRRIQAGGGIIGFLEVCEADFSKGLDEMTAAEDRAVDEYNAQTKENENTKVRKTQDVKYKRKGAKGLDRETAEAIDDRDGVQEELDAVLAYYKEIRERCIAKLESYAERVKLREAEIAGLQEALSSLGPVRRI